MTIFDKVQSKIDQSDFKCYYKAAAVCLYLCSKYFDAQYLYINKFILGISLTKVGNDQYVLNMDQESILKYENIIFQGIGFSLGYS